MSPIEKGWPGWKYSTAGSQVGSSLSEGGRPKEASDAGSDTVGTGAAGSDELIEVDWAEFSTTDSPGSSWGSLSGASESGSAQRSAACLRTISSH